MTVKAPPKVAAPVTPKVPPTVAFPKTVAPAPVVSVVAVRLPVTLLVPTIDNPPEPFEIWPVEFTCVQDTYPTVEMPVTVSPPHDVTTLQTRAFVVSTVMPN